VDSYAADSLLIGILEFAGRSVVARARNDLQANRSLAFRFEVTV